MAASYILTGDYKYYLFVLDRINKVSESIVLLLIVILSLKQR